MANWVADFLARNPDLAGLPVHKRARHGLHLRLPSGAVQAAFTGKPCHYLAGAEWLPLDTALVVGGDGSLGAPGVPVRIAADGTVSIEGTAYSQRTARVGRYRPSTRNFAGVVSVPGGSRAGDSLIAGGTIGGAGWSRVLRLTEDGVREELTLDARPSLSGIQAGDYLVLETLLAGLSLPDGEVAEFTAGGMRFPLPSAHDATGAECPTTRRYARTVSGQQYLYTGVPVSWLASASYPVVIDPDFEGDSADTCVYGSSGVYATARSTSASTYTGLYVGQTTTFYINRSYLKFVTSSISPAVVTAATLTLTVTTDESAADFDIAIVKQDWSAQDPIAAGNREAAYDNALTADLDDSIWRNTSGMSVNTPYASGALNTAWVNTSGSTYYSLVSAEDRANSQPAASERALVANSAHTTAAYRPVLTVTYSAAAATLAARRSLLGVGI